MISRSSLGVRFSRLLLGFDYISPCVIVSKIRPQPLKTPREQPSTFSAVKLPSKRKPALKRCTGAGESFQNFTFSILGFLHFQRAAVGIRRFCFLALSPLGGIAQRTGKQPDTRKRGKTVHFRKRGKGIYPLTDTAERNCPA